VPRNTWIWQKRC